MKFLKSILKVKKVLKSELNWCTQCLMFTDCIYLGKMEEEV